MEVNDILTGRGATKGKAWQMDWSLAEERRLDRVLGEGGESGVTDVASPHSCF